MQIWFHCCKEIRKYENKCVNTTGEKSRKKGKRHLSGKKKKKTKATIQTISIMIQKFIFFVCFPIRNKYS